MSANCYQCRNKVSSKQKSLKCQGEDCGNIIHTECSNLPLGNSNWLCNACAPRTTSLDAIMKEIKQLNADMSRSIDACHEEISENSSLMKNLNEKIDRCVSVVEEIDNKCKALEKENQNLVKELNRQEQYSRLNCIEISGVPECKGENVYTTVTRAAQIIGVSLSRNDIDSCHRLGNSIQPGYNRQIILKLVNRWKKEELLAARRVRRNLCVRDLNLDSPLLKAQDLEKSVYLNESLTKFNRALLGKCREYKKQNNIKFVWVRNGKILMRKTENSRVFVISSKEDLNDVV